MIFFDTADMYSDGASEEITSVAVLPPQFLHALSAHAEAASALCLGREAERNAA